MAETPDKADADQTLDDAEAVETKTVAFDPDRIRQFVLGEITLGELEGIDKPSQYKMAETGFGFLQAGKLENAKKVFRGLVSLDPRDAYFHMVLGSIAQREEDLEEAEACYSRSLRINPYSPSALANRGEVLIELGRIEEGMNDLRAALKEDPSAREAATQRARALLPAIAEKHGLAAGRVDSEAPTEGATGSYKDDGKTDPRSGAPSEDRTKVAPRKKKLVKKKGPPPGKGPARKGPPPGPGARPTGRIGGGTGGSSTGVSRTGASKPGSGPRKAVPRKGPLKKKGPPPKK